MFVNGFKRSSSGFGAGGSHMPDVRLEVLADVATTGIIPAFDLSWMHLADIRQMARVLVVDYDKLPPAVREKRVLDIYIISLQRGLALAKEVQHDLPARAGDSLHRSVIRRVNRLQGLLDAAISVRNLIVQA